MFRVIALLLLSLSLGAVADPISEERIWTGKNGQKIRGKDGMVSEDRRWLDLMVMGESRRIAISNLSDEDQAFIRSSLEETQPAPPPPSRRRPDRIQASRQSGSQPAATAEPRRTRPETERLRAEFRLQFPALVGSSGNPAHPPKRGEFADKAEWVHTVMARYCGTRNTAGTDVRAALDGIAEYFAKEVADLATVRSKVDHDLRPSNLSRYTRGANATMLEITTRRKHGSDGSHWVALMSAEDNGRVVLHTWGARFEGTLKVFEEDRTTVTVNNQTVPKTSYEIEFTNRDSLPQWVNVSGAPRRHHRREAFYLREPRQALLTAAGPLVR